MKKVIIAIIAVVILAGIAAFKFIPTKEHTVVTSYTSGEGVTIMEYIDGTLVSKSIY